LLRAIARLTLVVLVLGPTVVLTASPCAACSCVPQTPRRLFRDADAAFVGSVVGEQAVDERTTLQTFRVRSVYKGELGSTVQVIAPLGSGGGSSCGILFGPGEVAVILHRIRDGQGSEWTTDVCSRITIVQLTRVAPRPTSPPPTPSPTPTLAPAPASGSDAGLGWSAVLIGLLAGVAAIALVLSFQGRRDRSGATALADPHEPVVEDPGDPPDPSG
jgi:hypothetical protein